MPKPKMDVRILTIKRLRQPLRIGLSKMLKQELEEQNSPNAHQYYCFQNRQIISIDRVDVRENEYTLDSAYLSIRKMRLRDAERLTANPESGSPIAPFVQQRLVIYGNYGSEWFDSSDDRESQETRIGPEESFETLSVSLLQLKDGYEIKKLKDMEEDLLRRVPRNLKKRCRLYHALDFCDCVLFIKNATAMEIQEVMWAITYPYSPDKPQVLRDSYTMLGINIRSLQQNLDRGITGSYDTGKLPGLAHGLLISLFLNSAKPLQDYLERIISEDKRIAAHKLLGRHDVQIQIPDGRTETLIKYVRQLDELCIGSDQQAPALCDYEISFLVNMKPDPDLLEINENPAAGNDWFSQMLERIRIEYKEYYNSLGITSADFDNPPTAHADSDDTPPVIGYAANLMNELDALSNNCFAEEFVMSVLPSFSAYLRCARYCQEEKAYTIKASLQKEYLEALSTMIHCTMHGEKQFVQAPALNLNIVDVPPKLLAYYSIAAIEVTKAVAKAFPDQKKKYSFLFVPDFRSDINVIRTPYIRNTGFDKTLLKEFENDQLLIVHLNERLFYSPHQTVAIICHELAHRIDCGRSRLREERAKAFFAAAASLYTLKAVKLAWYEFDTIPATQKALVMELSRQLGAAILDRYKIGAEQESQCMYYMSDIESFIIQSDYLYRVFSDESFAEHGVNNIAKGLETAKIRPLLKSLCEKYDTQNGASLTSAFKLWRNQSESPHMEYLIKTLAQWLYREITTVIRNYMNSEDFYFIGKWFEDLESNFKEAYADCRMIELLCLSRQQYERISTKNVKNWRESQDCRLRYRSVCLAKYRRIGAEDLPTPSDEDIILSEFIAEYLKECGTSAWPKMTDYQDLYKKDHGELLERIYQKLNDYRHNLTPSCDSQEAAEACGI